MVLKTRNFRQEFNKSGSKKVGTDKGVSYFEILFLVKMLLNKFELI